MHLFLFLFIAFCFASTTTEANDGADYEYTEIYDDDDEDESYDDDVVDEDGEFGGEDGEEFLSGDGAERVDEGGYSDLPDEGIDDINEYDYEYPQGLCELKRRKLLQERDDDDDADDVNNNNDDADVMFLPTCTDLGEFQLRQCHKGQCWCVDPQGVEIEGSRKDAVMSNGGSDFHCDEAYTENQASQHADKFDLPPSNHPAFLVAVIMLAILGLTGAVMISMFVVYRMRKKDEGSYALANHNNHNNILISANNNNNGGMDGKRSMLLNNNYLVKDMYAPQQQQQAQQHLPQQLPSYNYNMAQQQSLQQEFYA